MPVEKLGYHGAPARSVPDVQAACRNLREYLNSIPEGSRLSSEQADYIRKLADNLPTNWRLPTGRSENKLRAIGALLDTLPESDNVEMHSYNTKRLRVLKAIKLIHAGKRYGEIEEPKEADSDEEEE